MYQGANQSSVDSNMFNRKYDKDLPVSNLSKIVLPNVGILTNKKDTARRLASPSSRSKSPGQNGSLMMTSMEIRPEVYRIFEHHRELLQKLFHNYASYSGSNSTQKMRTIKLVKLLKDAHLLKVIGEISTHDS